MADGFAREPADDAELDDGYEDKAEAPEPGGRGKDLSKRPSIRKKLLDMFRDVEKGFTDQNDRANDQMDFWDIYNCQLGPKQFYTGNSQIYVPIVYNAIEARTTRFVNQIFPTNKRNIEVTSTDGTQPDALTALLEHYVAAARLRTVVLPALIRSGDVEGQYNVYVDWTRSCRYTASRRDTSATDMPGDSGIPLPDVETEEIVTEKIEDGHPGVEVLNDADVLVLPPTSDSIQECLNAGGSVTILRRWSKAKIQQMAKDGLINSDAADELIKDFDTDLKTASRSKDVAMAWAAGIKWDGEKHAVVYETWSKIRVKKSEDARLVVSFYGGQRNVLGAQVNPLWCDRCPLLSVPVKKVAGRFKGESQVKYCATMQYAANDAVNEGMDSAAYALMPVVMTDPEKNPRVGSMVMTLAAIWQTSPKDTQFAQFPPLWQDAFKIVEAAKQEIATALSISPSAIMVQNFAGRLTQAEVAVEQMADLLLTADAVTTLEEGILSPMATLFAEMDHQYRDREVTVRRYGEMGIEANMETVPPLQMNTRYTFRWLGVEAAKNAQALQQQIAGINVMRGIDPQQYQGYRLNLVPVLTQMMENLFGPRLAPLIFEDIRHQLSLDAETENKMLVEGFDLPVHPLDNDGQHLQIHMQALKEGDPNGTIRSHMIRHQQSMQIKANMAMLNAAQQGPPGAGPAPGAGGPPRIGAQPAAQRPAQGPPGQIQQSKMVDATRMPQI